MIFAGNVLACTDLSDVSNDAVMRAAMLAAAGGGRLGLVHVVKRGALDVLHDLLAPRGDQDLHNALLEQARDELDRLAERLSGEFSIPVDPVAEIGTVVREIVAVAARQDARLLVLGDRGVGLIAELVLGTCVERLLPRIQCPMLVVKSPPAPVRRVLVPVDFSAASLASIDMARQIAPDAEYLLLHAFQVPFEGKLRFAGVHEDQVGQLRIDAKALALKKMDELVERTGLPEMRVRRVLRHGEPQRCIIDEERNLDCDLIAMGRQGKGHLEEVLVGSVTRHVMSFSRGDVLVAVQ